LTFVNLGFTIRISNADSRTENLTKKPPQNDAVVIALPITNFTENTEYLEFPSTMTGGAPTLPPVCGLGGVVLWWVGGSAVRLWEL
jgi:hypothetical protein